MNGHAIIGSSSSQHRQRNSSSSSSHEGGFQSVFGGSRSNRSSASPGKLSNGGADDLHLRDYRLPFRVHFPELCAAVAGSSKMVDVPTLEFLEASADAIKLFGETS